MSSTTPEPASPGLARVPRWLQHALGIGPLALFAAFHVYLGYAALDSRDAWIERVHRLGLGSIGSVLVLGWLVGHGWLCAQQLLDRRRALSRDPSARDPWLAFQALASVLFFAFLGYHVVSLWPLRTGDYAGGRAVYDSLWASLGQPLPLCVYVVGATAFVFHLGTALARAFGSLTGKPRASRYVAGLLGFALWLLLLQIIGHFAIGEGLVPGLGARPEASGRQGSVRPLA